MQWLPRKYTIIFSNHGSFSSSMASFGLVALLGHLCSFLKRLPQPHFYFIHMRHNIGHTNMPI